MHFVFYKGTLQSTVLTKLSHYCSHNDGESKHVSPLEDPKKSKHPYNFFETSFVFKIHEKCLFNFIRKI